MKTLLTKEEIEFWNNSSITTYFESKPADPRIVKRLEKIKKRSTKRALDLGCGGGRHTELLFKLGFEVYACDINPEMLNVTTQRVKEYLGTKSNSSILYGPITKIPFEDQMFDVVVTTGVLHQAKSIEEYKKAIKELSRVTAPGAIIALNIFTNAVWDDTYTKIDNELYTLRTKEGLYMTILPKEEFYDLMDQEGFLLEAELSEDIKEENTGKRAVLRANFVKRDV